MVRKWQIFRCRSTVLSVTAASFLIAFAFLNHVQQMARHGKGTASTGYYNLMEDKQYEYPAPVVECTLEYVNDHKLQQDHPCVIDVIRKSFLHPPPSSPYNLENPPRRTDPSEGESTFILNRLRYPSKGFFVECGASDGELLSTTLYMERILDWTGILIEPNPWSYEQLLAKNRNAWSLPLCLSGEPYPQKVQFNAYGVIGKILEDSSLKKMNSTDEHINEITVQCFPLYSILLAANRTQVDFFSLDVEGHELKVLKTVPWHKVDIKTMAIEWEHIEEGEKALIRYMKESAGYLLFNRLDFSSKDLFFISSKHAPQYKLQFPNSVQRS